MLAVGAIVALGLVSWWSQRNEEPGRPPVRPIPSVPSTIREKWQNEITAKLRLKIAVFGDRDVQDKEPPKSQFFCSLVKPESWDVVRQDLEAFCLKEKDSSTSTDSAKQISSWAKSLIAEIEKLDDLNKRLIELRLAEDLLLDVQNQIGTQISKLTSLFQEQLEAVQGSEIPIYKQYCAVLQKISDTKRWSALLSFLKTESSMWETALQLMVCESHRKSDSDKSEEEYFSKLVKDETNPNFVATAVIEATEEHTMLKSGLFGEDIVRFPTGFSHRVVAPKSTEGTDFSKAVQGATATAHAEAIKRLKMRKSWFHKDDDGSSWGPVPKNGAPLFIFKGDKYTREMDKFLEAVE